MAFDGNGTFLRIMNWVQDAAAGIKIKADRHDQQDDDYAAGLSNCITKDGQTQPTNNIPMNGKKITNLATPTAATDAANKSYVDALKTFSTGLVISGADANGRLNFSSATGANGLSFTGADLSWLAKLSPNRLVLNDKPDGSGADVVTILDSGALTAKQLTVANASASLSIKPTSGNGAVYWFATDGVTARMQMFISSGAQSDGIIAVGSQNFTHASNGQFKAPGALFASSAYLNTDGNITGSVWSPWGYSDAFSAIGSRIETRGQAWANDRISQLQYRKVSQGYSGTAATFTAPAGAVINGYAREAGNAGQVMGLYFMYLQVYDPVRGWVGFTG
jgi:hypothetical protein